jgi:hypothetical protein
MSKPAKKPSPKASKRKAAKRKQIKVLCPPKEGENPIMEPVMCGRGEEEKGCGNSASVAVSRERNWDNPIAICTCGGNMYTDISKYRTGISARGPGFHGTKFGMRRKRDMIARSEKVGKSQWENHEVRPPAEGARVENPTPGGPLDPNGPFAKKKTKKIITY